MRASIHTASWPAASPRPHRCCFAAFRRFSAFPRHAITFGSQLYSAGIATTTRAALLQFQSRFVHFRTIHHINRVIGSTSATIPGIQHSSWHQFRRSIARAAVSFSLSQLHRSFRYSHRRRRASIASSVLFASFACACRAPRPPASIRHRRYLSLVIGIACHRHRLACVSHRAPASGINRFLPGHPRLPAFSQYYGLPQYCFHRWVTAPLRILVLNQLPG